MGGLLMWGVLELIAGWFTSWKLPIVSWDLQTHLILVLGVLTMNLCKTSILLQLEGFGVVWLWVVDVFDGTPRSWLAGLVGLAVRVMVMVCMLLMLLVRYRHLLMLHGSAATYIAYHSLMAMLDLRWLLWLSLGLLFLYVLCITPTITGLGPCVDHLDFLETAPHHSVVRVLIRAEIGQRENKFRIWVQI